jgi:hypothetical protein
MKTEIINAVESYLESGVKKHRVNINVLLFSPQVIPEHTNIVEAVDRELDQLVNYEDKLHALRKHFK